MCDESTVWSGREIAIKDATAAAAPVGVAGAVLGSAAALRPSEERLEACSCAESYNYAPSHKTRPYYFLPLKEHPETSCRKVLFILTELNSSSAKRFRGHVFTAPRLERPVLRGRHTSRRRPSRSSNPEHHRPFRKPSIWHCFLLSLELGLGVGLGTETHFCCTLRPSLCLSAVPCPRSAAPAEPKSLMKSRIDTRGEVAEKAWALGLAALGSTDSPTGDHCHKSPSQSRCSRCKWVASMRGGPQLEAGLSRRLRGRGTREVGDLRLSKF